MEIIGVLLFLATGVGLLFLGIFFWAYRGEQFDDIESPARRMLFDAEDRPVDHKPGVTLRIITRLYQMSFFDFQSVLLWLPLGSFIAGLTTTPHCAVMCGPLFILFGEGGPGYQIGRVAGYTALGALAGFFGASMNLAGEFLAVQHLALYFVAATFVLYGVYQLIPPQIRARYLPDVSAKLNRWLVARMGALQKNTAGAARPADGQSGAPIAHHDDSRPDGAAPSATAQKARPRSMRLALTAGTLSALLPCGPLIPLWILAAGSGGAASGALLSGGFVLGTLPGAALIAWSGRRLGGFASLNIRRFAGAALLIAGITLLGMRQTIGPPTGGEGQGGDPVCHTPESLFLYGMCNAGERRR